MTTEGPERLSVHPLFLGLTRNAQMMGLPIMTFAGLLSATMTVFILSKSLWSVVIFPLGYAVLYVVELWRPRLWSLLWLRISKTPLGLGRRHWGGSSYRPTQIHLPSTVKARLQRGNTLTWERTVERMIPYTVHEDRWTLAHQAGPLLQFVVVPGLASETLDTAQINYRLEQLNALWRNLANSHYALYCTTIRRAAVVEPPGELEGVAGEITEALTEELRASVPRENVHYLTIMRRNASGAIGRAEGWWKRFVGQTDRAAWLEQREQERKELTEVVDQVCAALGPQYGARRLAVIETPEGVRSEIVEFLAEVLNGCHRPMLFPAAPLGRVLPTHRLTFGREVVEIRGPTRDDLKYAAILAIRQYGGRTWPGFLDRLLRLQRDLLISQSFEFADRAQAQSAIHLQERRLEVSEDAAHSQRSELEQAADAAASQTLAFGHHQLTIRMTAPTVAELDQAIAEVQAELTALGVAAERSDMALEADYFSQLPCNFGFVGRPVMISTVNFAGLASLHGSPRGEERGYWGPPILSFQTTEGTPMRFHFHSGGSGRDVGHYLVIGPNGSGKTVLMGSLMSAAYAQAKARILYIDKDRGAQIAIEAIGGDYLDLKPGQPTGMAPLSGLEDSPGARAFLRDLVGQLARTSASEALTARDREIIGSAVDQLMALPREQRRFEVLEEALGGSVLRRGGNASLRLWLENGERSWVFAGTEDRLDLRQRSVVGIDLTHVLPDPITRGPVLSYITYRFEEAYDGKPTILNLEEAWFVAQDSLLAPRIKAWTKTGRKKNLVLGFSSQSPQDVVANEELYATLKDNTATQFWFPNPKADAESCRKLGLSDKEIEIVRTLSDTSRCFLLHQSGGSVVVRLDLSGRPDLLSVLSGRTQTLARMDRIRERVGNDPSQWLPIFLDRQSEE